MRAKHATMRRARRSAKRELETMTRPEADDIVEKATCRGRDTCTTFREQFFRETCFLTNRSFDRNIAEGRGGGYVSTPTCPIMDGDATKPALPHAQRLTASVKARRDIGASEPTPIHATPPTYT